MDQARWNRIEEILQAALDVDTGERAAFVRHACGSDVQLHHDVTALLASGSDVLLLEAPAALSSGQQVSHYRIETRIGAGGMGEVYRATDERLRRTVALKTLPPKFMFDSVRLHRFEQEAFAASRLNHPNIVTIFETVKADDAHFIATEYIEGKTLRAMMAAKLPVDAALDIALQVAAALKAAHTAWIIHRDIKPENLMVRADGVVKVLDFGIAKLFDEPEPAPVPRSDVEPHATLTMPGAILGTSTYMSPEQARGDALDGRTDIFSLGVVLQEMVTGTRSATLLPDVPKPLERLLRKMLEPDRDERHATAGELIDDLKRVKQRIEGAKARRWIGVSALTAIAALALTAIAAVLSITEVWDERVMRDGHSAAARHAVFSPDGRFVVSCGEDGRVIVWDFARRQRIASADQRAYRVAFAPDGRSFVSGGADGTIVVWDTTTWRPVRSVRSMASEITALAFSPDGSLLASTHYGGTVLWDARRWEAIRRFDLGGASYGALLFSPDGQHLLSSYGFSVRGLREEKRGGLNFGNAFALSPDQRRIAAAESSGNAALYGVDWRGGFPRFDLLLRQRAHQDHGRAAAFSPDGRLFATGAEDIVVWDAVQGRKMARFEYSSIVWSVAFSPDGRWLISSHGDGAVLIWDVAERALAGSLNEHSAAVRGVAFSPDGHSLASAGEDRTVIVWDIAAGRKRMVLGGHQTRINAVAFSGDGKSIVSGDQDGQVIVWNAAGRQPRLAIASGPEVPVYSLAISRDGRDLASTMGLYAAADGRMLLDLLGKEHEKGHPYGLAFSPDDRMLAAVTDHGCVLLYDVVRRRLQEQFRFPDKPQICVSFAPDGKSFVTGDDEGIVRLWSASPLRELAIVGRHTARVKAVAFAPDGRTVASAGDDKMIALWDVRSRTLRQRIGTHTSPIYALAFSADGRQLASGEHDRSVRVYTRRRWLWRWRLD